MGDALLFAKFLADNAEFGAMVLAVTVAALLYFHAKRDEWIQGEMKHKLDQIGSDFEQHVGGCREDWEHQKVANAKAKSADDRVLDAISTVRAQLAGLDGKMSDARDRLARIEGRLRETTHSN